MYKVVHFCKLSQWNSLQHTSLLNHVVHRECRVWFKNPYLRKLSLHLRQYSIYRLHCITKVNTNDISIHHIYHYSVNIFRAFFSLRWMECVCLHVGRRACCSQQKQVAFSHQPHVCLEWVAEWLTAHQPSSSDGLGATWPFSKSLYWFSTSLQPPEASPCSSVG